MSRRQQSKTPVVFEATIDSLSPEGRGVAHIDGKATFIDGALPGETVRARYHKRRKRMDEAEVVGVIHASSERVQPKCPHFGICGGCRLQHLDASAQIRHKQQALMQQLKHIGGVQPLAERLPMTAPVWGYRHKARLGVKYVDKKEKVLVGFRERGSAFLADIERCEVLHPSVGELITPLSELIGSLTVYRQVPQIEVAIGEDRVALVLRHLAPLTADDHALLQQFERTHEVCFFLQPGGPDTIQSLNPSTPATLRYHLPKHAIDFAFRPTDFTQVNPSINERLIDGVIDWLQPTADDRVLDLFCGLGNFSLPLARRAGRVTGVEGDAALVERARANALANQIDNAEFFSADLAANDLQAAFMYRRYNKVLLDPPRSGAATLIDRLNWNGVERIAYVSCNPATLARDSGALVNEHGFELVAAGVLDMFPHTAHVESLALFQRAAC
ncbi:23S rRNA (uracil1939-C5)-methyltransferase [Methylohalomonas lacus]|uniref:23S rRNA (uracil(1939)-C(5))-methyltransferase RlmD n=1 Tax=Methylohalomonas lacus TaxID=398773 RepID=A0AAE3HMK0_9GAMM|nr:23S rRNA (uracil(1939)-C(5))-methyltransferase RlmD [Methylohalomonas lacus]MCS3903916.1 23S rRNA (uracil1939-C5)-methyltransferase [Methylohalomonas lacus]